MRSSGIAVPSQVRAALERANRARVARPDDAARLTLYRLFQGPIATTLDNRREPFVAVEPAPPGKNVYPWDLTRAELDAYLAAHPEQRAELTHLRSVVRRADAASLRADLAALRRHPVLDALHPGLRARLEAMARRPSAATLYGLPYSVAYADRAGPRPRPAQRGRRSGRGRATRNLPAICATAPAICSPTITNWATRPGSPAVSAISTPRSAPMRPMTTSCSAPAPSIR